MISGIDAKTARFLVDLERIRVRQESAQRAVSSGFRVSRPSDDPSRVVDILQLRSEAERAGNISVNLDRVTAEVDSAEAAVNVAVQLVERARVLAISTSSTGVSNRKGIAVEARELHRQLVALTETSSEGRYVFSGDRDDEVLYTTAWAAANGVSELHSANNTRLIEDVHGARFSVQMSAHEIFDARNEDGTFADHNVFKAVYDLARALEDDDRDLVVQSMDKLQTSLDHLGRVTTFYGHVQNRVDHAITLTERSVIARKRELSEAQDTDIAESLVQMKLAEVHQQAALGAQSQVTRKSLFDFLG